jgi:hypothetical protein
MNRVGTISAFILPLSIGLVISVFPHIGYGFDFLPGDLGDTRFNLFLLENASQFLLGETDEFWNAGFMYPEAEVISISDNLLGSAPFYVIFRILGLNVFTSFQCWFILIAILNYWSAFKLSDYLLKNKWLAGLSAFIFAFSISLASQMSHAQTFPRFAFPLVILGLLLWRKHLNWKYFAFSITLLVYQFYCGIYLGFLTVVPFLILFVIIVFSNFKPLIESLKRIKIIILYSVSIVVNIFLLHKLFAPYLRRSEHAEPYSFGNIKHSLPELKSYLSAPPETLIHGPFELFIGKDYPAHWDHWIFPGWLIVVFFVFSGVLLFTRWFEKSKALSREHYVILLTGLLTFSIFLRIGDTSIYFLVHQLPGFSAMRSLTRIINVELLFFGLSLAIGLLYFIKKRQVSSFLIFLLILPLLTIDNYRSFDAAYRVSKSEVEARHNTLVEKMNHLPKGTVIAYEPKELKDPPHLYQLDAMLAAQTLKLKSVNGYSAKAAPYFDRYWLKPNKENRAFWFERFPNSDTISVIVIK